MSDVTRLLDAAAAARITAETSGHSLNSTALVHEMHLRLVGDHQFDDRSQFFAAFEGLEFPHFFLQSTDGPEREQNT